MGIDVDYDTLTYILVTSPTNGTLSNCMGLDSSLPTDRYCNYTPNANYVGSDSFEYKVSDGTLESANNLTVNITVNTIPVPGADQSLAGVTEDLSYNFTLNAGSDDDGQTLTYPPRLVSPSEAGSVSGCLNWTSSTTCTFTPSLDFNGPVTITYWVHDGFHYSSSYGTLSFTVAPVNDPPLPPPDWTGMVLGDITTPMSLAASEDVDSSPDYIISTLPTNGVLANCMGLDSSALTDLDCDYTPTATYIGPDSFQYYATDGEFDTSGTPTTVVLSVGACDFNIVAIIKPSDLPVCENADWLVPTGVTVELELESSINIDSLTIQTGGVLTHKNCTITPYKCYKIDLAIAGDVDIQLGGEINVTGRGYLGGHRGENSSNNYGKTIGNLDGAYLDYSGASHGGYGGKYSSTYSSVNIYGDLENPTLPGSGGGSYSTNKGGNGGGVVRLTIVGSLTINGSIKVNGGNSEQYTSYGAGGGSGGSIYINTNTLISTGSPTLEAKGGNDITSSVWGHGGGGGRIALFYDSNSGFPIDSSGLLAHGGTDQGYDRHGGAGSIFYKNKASDSFGHLLYSNGDLAAATTTLPTEISRTANQDLTLDSLTIEHKALVVQETYLTVTDQYVLDTNVLEISSFGILSIPDNEDDSNETFGTWFQFSSSTSVDYGVNLIEN